MTTNGNISMPQPSDNGTSPIISTTSLLEKARVFFFVNGERLMSNHTIEELCAQYQDHSFSQLLDHVFEPYRSSLFTENGIKGLYGCKNALKYVSSSPFLDGNTRIYNGLKAEAIGFGDIKELAFIHQSLNVQYKDEDIVNAARSGILEMVQHLYATHPYNEPKGSECLALALEEAAKVGHLHIVRWLCVITNIPTLHAIGIAMYYDKKEVVEWLYKNTIIYKNQGKKIYCNSKKHITKNQRDEMEHIGKWLAIH